MGQVAGRSSARRRFDYTRPLCALDRASGGGSSLEPLAGVAGARRILRECLGVPYCHETASCLL
jgi:hypothetical protein